MFSMLPPDVPPFPGRNIPDIPACYDISPHEAILSPHRYKDKAHAPAYKHASWRGTPDNIPHPDPPAAARSRSRRLPGYRAAFFCTPRRCLLTASRRWRIGAAGADRVPQLGTPASPFPRLEKFPVIYPAQQHVCRFPYFHLSSCLQILSRQENNLYSVQALHFVPLADALLKRRIALLFETVVDHLIEHIGRADQRHAFARPCHRRIQKGCGSSASAVRRAAGSQPQDTRFPATCGW